MGIQVAEDPVFLALLREARSAGAHLCGGATKLSYAAFDCDWKYLEAFFDLSVGIERGCKLALLLDHALQNGGTFPSRDAVKGKFGHDLKSLLEAVDAMSARRNIADPHARLPRTLLHDSIIEVLTRFADNKLQTRYYNIDFLTGGANPAASDPISEWYTRVMTPVFDKHVSKATRERDAAQTKAIGTVLDMVSVARFTDEEGKLVTSASAGMARGAAISRSRPFVRMYVLQLARFVATNLCAFSGSELRPGGSPIPSFRELLYPLLEDDNAFRGRKTWTLPG